MKIKKERGVTLIALIVMIIIILIIATITVYSGVSTLQESKEKRLITELEMVHHAVLERYTTYKIIKNEDYLVGDVVNQSDIPSIYIEYNYIRSVAFLSTAKIDEKYYLLNSEALKDLGITNSANTYIVNYSSGEVMNYDIQETISGKILYISSDFKAYE